MGSLASLPPDGTSVQQVLQCLCGGPRRTEPGLLLRAVTWSCTLLAFLPWASPFPVPLSCLLESPHKSTTYTHFLLFGSAWGEPRPRHYPTAPHSSSPFSWHPNFLSHHSCIHFLILLSLVRMWPRSAPSPPPGTGPQ